MENIKPEEILDKHVAVSSTEQYNEIITAMMEYSQIACSTLSEEGREKDIRIEELEEHNMKLMDGIVMMNEGINYLYTGNEQMADLKLRNACNLLKSLKTKQHERTKDNMGFDS